MNKIGRIEIVVLSIVALVFAYGVYLSYADHDYFRSVYVVEDGPLEWMTVVALLLSMGACARRLLPLKDKRSVPFLLTTSFLVLFFFFGAGEEISWGQRLFGIESSSYFKQNNAQSETNLHNLVVDGKKINKMIFGTGLALVLMTYLAVVTPLYRREAGPRRFFAYFGTPIPKNYQIAAYIILLIIVEGFMESPKRGELTEFVGSFIVFLNIAFPYNENLFDPTVEDYRS